MILDRSLCEEIKAKLTLREGAAMLGIQLPERDGKKFPSPLRPDRTPSCEVYRDHIVDRSSDERFDLIALWAAHRQLTTRDAVHELADRLGIARRTSPTPSYTSSKPDMTMTPNRPSAYAKFKALGIRGTVDAPELPEALPYSKDLSRAVADSRGLDIRAVEFAGLWLKTISFATVKDFPGWFIRDRQAPGWEARRIDGQPYPADEKNAERKSHCRGKIKSWPMGIAPGGFTDAECKEHMPKILLCEGMPDYLAGCQIAISQERIDCLPVAMLGKGADIHHDALKIFAERTVVIAAHSDAEERAGSWARQIAGAGAGSTVIKLCPVDQDLNDILKAGHSAANLYKHLFSK